MDGVPEMAKLPGSSEFRTMPIRVALVLALGAAITTAHAAVYKCTDTAGKTTYSDLPCNSHSKPLKLGDPKGNATDPHMCEQLLDELNRVSAEADRGNKAGHPPSPSSMNRRKALTRQYEARCVGISRSK